MGPQSQMSYRRFCLCCVATTTFAATGGASTPRQAFAKARGIVESIKASAAVAPIVTHPLRGGVFVLEGSGGNIAVLTGREGKLLVDCGIGVSIIPTATHGSIDRGDDTRARKYRPSSDRGAKDRTSEGGLSWTLIRQIDQSGFREQSPPQNAVNLNVASLRTKALALCMATSKSLS